ncbi:hypothetical protein NFI96_017353, partial [Prochilodus magdalenae]
MQSQAPRLRMERSSGILRGMPSVVNFSNKAGNPKKRIRYTSIKKATPKTVIDIGKLLLQKASDTKVNKQSAVAEAALKATTAKPTALNQPAALNDSMAAVASAQKAPPASSDDESVAPVAAGFVDTATTTSDAMKLPVMSGPCEKGSYEATRSVDQGMFPENVGQETVPESTTTKKISPEASGFLELPPPFSTSFEASTGEVAGSPPKAVHKNDPDEITSALRATPGAVPDVAPIDVTYSEEVVSISDLTDIEIASMEPPVGVLSATGTVTTEIVDSQSVSAADVPTTPELFSAEVPPLAHSSTKVTPSAGGVEIIHASQEAVSTPVLSSEGARVEDVRPETPADLAYAASSSSIISEKGAVAGEITPEIKVSPHAVSHVLPYEDTAIQEAAFKEVVSSSDIDSEKAAHFDSGVVPVGKENLLTTAKVPGDSVGPAEDTVAMTEKVLDLTPKMLSGASVTQNSDPAHGDSAEEGLKAEGEEAFKESSEAQLDPIKRLFLDKIREYSTRSKAHHGLVDAGPEYEKAFSEELTKLQRLYGNGDLTTFPEFRFP